MKRLPGATSIALALVALSLTASGCGESGPPPVVAVSAACDESNRGDRVTVNGYLRLPESVSIGQTAVIDLFSKRGGEGDRVSVELEVGDGPNQLRDLPERFSATALRVGTADGDATIIDEVAVTAKVEESEGSCTLKGPEIVLTGTSPRA